MAFKILALLLFFLVGCVAQTTHHEQNNKAPDIVWPMPPDTPRIRYLRAFYRLEDFWQEKVWLKKVWEVIVGKKEVILVRPYSVAVDEEGKIYVVDTGLSLVYIFDMVNKKYKSISYSKKGRLRWPVAVVTDPQGNIYVSDAELKKVIKYDKNGKALLEIGAALMRPTGLAFHKIKNYLYVVDTYAHQVLVFGPDGEEIFSFGGRGMDQDEFNFPVHIWIDSDGLVYVCDTMNFRIKIFSADGKFLSQFGELGDVAGRFSKPKGVAVDSLGHIYVVEGLYDVVQVFNKEGQLLLVFGGTGNQPGQFWLPAGIFVDRADKIYVADSYNQRIQMFEYIKDE